MLRVRWRSIAVVVVGLVVSPALVACEPSSDDRELIVYYADGVFPYESLADWVTFAEQVSVFRVDHERAGPTPPFHLGRQPDTPRYVTITVEDTLWSCRPPRPRAEVHTYGWADVDGELFPTAPDHGPRLEVGRRYLAPLVHFDGEFGPMSGGAVLPLDGDQVDIGPRSSQLADSLDGVTVAEIAERLARANPRPPTEDYAHVPRPECTEQGS